MLASLQPAFHSLAPQLLAETPHPNHSQVHLALWCALSSNPAHTQGVGYLLRRRSCGVHFRVSGIAEPCNFAFLEGNALFRCWQDRNAGYSWE